MLRIRLRRTGAKKQPRYRVVVAESRAPRDGAFVEILGWYNPQAEPSQVVVDAEKATAWLQKGAQPSERVVKLFQRLGVIAGGPAPALVEPPPAPVEPVEPAPAPARRARRPRAAAAAEPAAAAAEPTVAEATTSEEPEAQAEKSSD